MDTDFCVLLALGTYLETFLSKRAGGHRFLFGDSDEDDEPIRINERYQQTLCETWKAPRMVDLSKQYKGGLGTHSVRKFPCTWAAEHGVCQDHTEIRGRWKGGKGGKTVNRYINVEQLPTDGHVASILCVGGPMKYLARNGSRVTLEFLKDHVVPGIHDYFQGDESNKIVAVLRMAVLYAAHQPELEHLLPEDMLMSIQQA
jgi:hypothetical protein